MVIYEIICSKRSQEMISVNLHKPQNQVCAVVTGAMLSNLTVRIEHFQIFIENLRDAI